MKDMYSSLLGIPVAGATLPIIAFLLLSVYGKNLFLFITDLNNRKHALRTFYCHKQ